MSTVQFPWFYNSAGRSLLAAMLLPSINTATKFLPMTIIGLPRLCAFLVFIIVRDRMWQKEIPAKP